MLGSVDYIIHTARGQLGLVKWKKYRNKPYEYYYAEKGLYAIRKIGSNVFHLVMASNPGRAFVKLMEEERRVEKK